MARQSSIVGLLLSCLTTSLLLQPIHASFEANSAYEFAKLIQKKTAGAVQIVHVQNYTVTTPSTSVLKQETIKDRCSCRMACDANIPDCSVMSYDSDTKTCTLANGIARATPTPGATYTYIVPAITRITKEKDGLYYYLDPTNQKTYFAAQLACYQRGFRLAISRSAVTSDVFKQFHQRYPNNNIWIGMKKINGAVGLANLRWGDDTTVDSASISSMALTQDGWPPQYFVNTLDLPFAIGTDGTLNDMHEGWPQIFLCQANFDRLPLY